MQKRRAIMQIGIPTNKRTRSAILSNPFGSKLKRKMVRIAEICNFLWTSESENHLLFLYILCCLDVLIAYPLGFGCWHTSIFKGKEVVLHAPKKKLWYFEFNWNPTIKVYPGALLNGNSMSSLLLVPGICNHVWANSCCCVFFFTIIFMQVISTAQGT